MNILFLVCTYFPFGIATSMRARNLCALLKLAGHNVHVISDYKSKFSGEFDVCTYQNVFEKEVSPYKMKELAAGIIKALDEYCKNNKVDAVLTNSRFDRYQEVSLYCKKNSIKLFYENCEWYDVSNFKLGYFDPRYVKNQKMITQGFRDADGFISISRLLDEHNKAFGKPSVRIPTILDVQNAPLKLDSKNDKIVIVYTGSPGVSKEFLYPVVRALSQNRFLRERIEFHIYGPNEKQVLKNAHMNKKLLDTTKNCVFVHGKVPQETINDVLLNADYQLFLRPDRRSSNAGFPTKLGESMAVGTPVISNDTGDIGLYLKDGYNGFLIQGISVYEINSVLEKICELDCGQMSALRNNARKTALESFDYRGYLPQINQLFGTSEKI